MAKLEDISFNSTALRLALDGIPTTREGRLRIFRLMAWEMYHTYEDRSFRKTLFGFIPISIKVKELKKYLILFLGPDPFATAYAE